MFHLTTHHHSFTKKADIVVKICSYNEHRVYAKNNRLIKQHGGFANCWYDSCITRDELGLAWVASKLLFKKLLIQNKVDYFKQSEFLAPRVQNSLAIFLSYSLNFHIDHNASCLPPKFCITHCFTFLLRGGSRIFFRRGCTRLLLYFNTNKPHSFFLAEYQLY